MIIIQCFNNTFLESVLSRIIQEATPLHLDRQIDALQTLTDLSSFVSTCVCEDSATLTPYSIIKDLASF